MYNTSSLALNVATASLPKPGLPSSIIISFLSKIDLMLFLISVTSIPSKSVKDKEAGTTFNPV